MKQYNFGWWWNENVGEYHPGKWDKQWASITKNWWKEVRWLTKEERCLPVQWKEGDGAESQDKPVKRTLDILLSEKPAKKLKLYESMGEYIDTCTIKKPDLKLSDFGGNYKRLQYTSWTSEHFIEWLPDLEQSALAEGITPMPELADTDPKVLVTPFSAEFEKKVHSLENRVGKATSSTAQNQCTSALHEAISSMTVESMTRSQK